MPNPIKIKATVIDIKCYSTDIFKVTFSVPSRATKFKPGQFLHLALDSFDPSIGYWPDSRVFSICSCPGSDSIEFIYSIKGQFTKRMSHELQKGKEVWLKLPYGDFIFEPYFLLLSTSLSQFLT